MNVKKYILLPITALLLLTGCLGDDNSVCPRPFQVTVRALCADMTDITHLGDAEEVILYMFNERGDYLNHFVLNHNHIVNKQPIEIRFAYGTEPASILFKAWANLCDRIESANPADVNHRSDFFVQKKLRDTRNTADLLYADSPGDLFFGLLGGVEIERGSEGWGTPQVVDIHRRTTGITITTVGLSGVDEYHYEVHGAVSALNYNGNYTGDWVKKAPEAEFLANGNFFAPIFRKFFPDTQETITVDIFHNNSLLHSVTVEEDINGNSIAGQAGRTINIHIDLTGYYTDGTINVTTRITPWDVVWQHVEWQ